MSPHHKRRACRVTHILYIVGCKNAGKTRLTELLVPRLSVRIGAIGTVKNAERGHFDWEVAGTDTHRHFQAGSAITSIISGGVFSLEQRDPTPSFNLFDVVRNHYGTVRLVLAEGFAASPGLKIEVQRAGYTDRAVIEDADSFATYGDKVLPRPSRHFPYDAEDQLSDYIIANLDRLARVN